MSTISILKNICKINGVSGYSKLCKKDLIKLCKLIDKKPLYILPLEKSKVKIDNLKNIGDSKYYISASNMESAPWAKPQAKNQAA